MLSREFALVAACCRWPLTADRAANLQRMAREPLDWDEVLRNCRQHRVFGLVHHALQAGHVPCPPAVEAALAREARAIARRNLMLAAEALRLQEKFDYANIPLRILKGLPLAQRAYRTISLKHGRDIDLVVPLEHAGAALRLLEADGYALVDPARELTAQQREAFIVRGYEMELRHAGRGTRVELHWRLSENRHLTSGIAAFAEGQPVPLLGGVVRTLNDADLFVYLCVHGANHFWFRLKWLADLDALIGAIEGLQVSTLYRHAQAHGAGLCAAQALLLCERILGRALPEALRDEMTSDRRVRRLVDIAVREMTGSAAAERWPRRWSRQATETGWRFLLGRGFGFVAAQCGIALTAPADVIRWPLPRRFHFIYPLLWLPSWVIRRAAGLRRGAASEFTRSATED